MRWVVHNCVHFKFRYGEMTNSGEHSLVFICKLGKIVLRVLLVAPSTLAFIHSSR